MSETLEAGRALDQLVAERVMNWKPGSYNGAPTWCDQSGIRCEQWQWKPSTSIADAWLVVEKLGREWTKDNESTPYSGISLAFNGKTWSISSGIYADYELAEAPTAPHAICLAALKAVGG